MLFSADINFRNTIQKRLDLSETITSLGSPPRLPLSEIPIRGLKPRMKADGNDHDTIEAIRLFHATRLEWIYGLTPQFIEQVNSMNVSVSGTLSTATGIFDKSDPDWRSKVSILDLDQKPLTAPWMRSWNPPGLWMCINNPIAREAYLAAAKELIDLGVVDIQRDDPLGNEHAFSWGGCFCEYCLTGFAQYLQANLTNDQIQKFGIKNTEKFDYKKYLEIHNVSADNILNSNKSDKLRPFFLDFQRQSTINFHKWWRDSLNEYAKHYVLVSSNNNGRRVDGVYDLFDFWIGELPKDIATPAGLYRLSRQVKSRHKQQILTMPLLKEARMTPEWITLIRNSIATSYALGMYMEAPWDTYLPLPHAPRFFGKADDFSDLYGMIRASKEYLDGYEDAAVDGGGVFDERWSEGKPVSLKQAAENRLIVVRVKPGNRNAPIVVHLIDWSAKPTDFNISLNPDLLFKGEPFKVELITPISYNPGLHKAAFETKDYSELIKTESIDSGNLRQLMVPAVTPWGILVLNKL